MHQQSSSPVISTASTMANGPPPSYEAVVAMDQVADGCDKCAKCACIDAVCPRSDSHKFCSIDSEESMTESVNQILNVGELNQRNGRRSSAIQNHRYGAQSANTNELDLTQKCRCCGNQMDITPPPSAVDSARSCNCATCQVDLINDNEARTSLHQTLVSTARPQSPVGHSNEAAISSSTENQCDVCDQNGNRRLVRTTSEDEANGNHSIDLNVINNNGLVRVNMSQIIDRTGLPTYEAALKLESSGYV